MGKKWFDEYAKITLVIAAVATGILWIIGQVPLDRLIALLGLVLEVVNYINAVHNSKKKQE